MVLLFNHLALLLAFGVEHSNTDWGLHFSGYFLLILVYYKLYALLYTFYYTGYCFTVSFHCQKSHSTGPFSSLKRCYLMSELGCKLFSCLRPRMVPACVFHVLSGVRTILLSEWLNSERFDIVVNGFQPSRNFSLVVWNYFDIFGLMVLLNFMFASGCNSRFRWVSPLSFTLCSTGVSW